jgi:hypothetical protein
MDTINAVINAVINGHPLIVNIFECDPPHGQLVRCIQQQELIPDKATAQFPGTQH